MCICAVVVTFNPEVKMLKSMIQRVLAQVDHILVVDNGSDLSPEGLLENLPESSVTLLSLKTNLGLASAQNKGACWARDQSFTHLLLLDQDSLPEPDMVAELMNGLTELQNAGKKIAAVGPVYTDPRTGTARHFVRFPGWSVEREQCASGRPLVPVDFLIASGTLMPLDIYEAVGGFKDELFIDNVDLEWSFRARGRGFALYGVCAARMQHSVGDTLLRVWLGRWWHVHRHSPLRQYYMARNRVYLYREPHSPKGWILQDGLHFLAKMFWFGVIFSPRVKNLRMILRGLSDGIHKRMGPYRAS